MDPMLISLQVNLDLEDIQDVIGEQGPSSHLYLDTSDTMPRLTRSATNSTSQISTLAVSHSNL